MSRFPRSRAAWLNVSSTVFLLGTTSLLADISSEMVSTTLPLYLLLSLRISPFQIGLMDGVYQGAAVLVRVISGVVADRRRQPKQVAAVGYALSAICNLGFLVAGGSWTAISGVILFDRIGKGIRTAPRDAMIAASSLPGQLATAFGVHRAMDTAGAMLGPLLAVGILTFVGQRYDAIFVVSFCVALIGVSVIALFVRNPDEPTSGGTDNLPDEGLPRRAPPLSLLRMGALIERSEFRTLVVVGSALSLVTVSDSLLYLALQQRVTIPAGVFPLLYVATALVFMILAIPAGRLADRLGHGVMFVLGYGLLAVVYGMLLLPSMNNAAAFVILILLGSYYAATDGVLMALASRRLPPDLRATGLALLTTGTGLARLVASALYGAIWGAYGAERALTVFIVGLIAAVWLARRSLFRVHTH